MNFFHWDGKPLLPPDLLEAVEATREVRLEDGDVIFRPGRDDYETALRAAGRLGGAEALLDRPDLVAAAQAHWHRERCNSCVFSAYLSAERLAHGWETFVILEGGPAQDLADEIEELIAPRLAAPAIEIVSVIVPALDDPSALARLLDRLAALPHWSLVEVGAEDDETEGRLSRLGLRRDVELGYSSEILGFGPHPGAARTRQAPFTELAIRAKPPPRAKAHGRAVMADVRLPGISGSTFGDWGAETAELRSRMLGEGHEMRGKAKVSFVISEDAWRQATR